jgi:hypothetical protein
MKNDEFLEMKYDSQIIDNQILLAQNVILNKQQKNDLHKLIITQIIIKKDIKIHNLELEVEKLKLKLKKLSK